MSWFDEIRHKFVSPKTHPSIAITALNDLEPDEQEDHEELTSPSLMTGVAIIISYTDSKGQNSTRLVTCQRYDMRNAAGYITAFCHERRAVRAFRCDRIVDIFDPSSGECLSPVEAFLARFSPDATHQSGYGWGLSVRDRSSLIAFLNALVFVARCDQEYHPIERETLEDLVCRFWLRLELAGDPDCNSIIEFADRLAPDAETFWVSLHRIKDHPILSTIFRRAAGEVIASDGVVVEEEMYWGSKIDAFFANPE